MVGRIRSKLKSILDHLEHKSQLRSFLIMAEGLWFSVSQGWLSGEEHISSHTLFQALELKKVALGPRLRDRFFGDKLP